MQQKPLTGREWPTRVEISALILVLAITLSVYGDAFRGFFVQDDFGWLLYSRFNSFGEYFQSFFRFNAFGAYRPLSQETFFWLGQKLFGLWPPGFHLVSVTAHLGAVSLVYLLLRHFFAPIPSLVGTLVFAVHGAHLRSVYWISALPEPLALVFFLSAFLGFVRFDRTKDRRAYALSLVAMLFGIMSKESILPLPLVLGTYCILLSRRRLIWTIPYLALSGLYALFRAASGTVKAAPYALSFGRETWHNFLSYLSWSSGFSESLLKLKFGWTPEEVYPVAAGAFAAVVFTLVALSRHRRIAVFSLLWFLISLQPVLYFSRHNYAYYLAPALPAVSLLIASSLPGVINLRVWKRGLPAMGLTGFLLWSSVWTLRLEGKWWNERSIARRDFLAEMIKVDEQVPPGGTAYIFGLNQNEFDIFENGVAFRAFGISWDKFHFILPMSDQDLSTLARKLRETGSLHKSYCFVLDSGQIRDRTPEFRLNPDPFFDLEPMEYLDRPEVRLEVSPKEVSRGKDTVVLRAVNLEAPAIDALYSIDGRMMPAITHWLLDEKQSTTVFVDESTPMGLYHFIAIRDSRDPKGWIKVDAKVVVR